MRVAVLDAGSNTVNLLIGDTGLAGAPPVLRSWKQRTFLARALRPDGTIGAAGRRRLVTAVAEALAESRRAGVESVFAYATAVVRDAPDCAEVLDEVTRATGLRLGLLTGVEEAEATFGAARRWLGWCAGPILLADIGGGSLELAFGRDRTPEWATSLDLGARVLTRRFLGGDPPPARAARDLRRHVREELRQTLTEACWEAPATAVAASKTFQQLARLTGAAPQRRGPYVARRLHRRALRPWIDRLPRMPVSRRAKLPGVSEHRAGQIAAGAIVAYEVLRGFGLTSVQICPWGLREGILLHRLDAGRPQFGGADWTPLPGSPHELAA